MERTTEPAYVVFTSEDSRGVLVQNRVEAITEHRTAEDGSMTVQLESGESLVFDRDGKRPESNIVFRNRALSREAAVGALGRVTESRRNSPMASRQEAQA
jgi:hypothetical protein